MSMFKIETIPGLQEVFCCANCKYAEDIYIQYVYTPDEYGQDDNTEQFHCNLHEKHCKPCNVCDSYDRA